jgi:hypothetical protein
MDVSLFSSVPRGKRRDSTSVSPRPPSSEPPTFHHSTVHTRSVEANSVRKIYAKGNSSGAFSPFWVSRKSEGLRTNWIGHKMCLLFLYNLCSKRLSLRYGRDTRRKAYRSSCKMSDINQYWTMVTNLKLPNITFLDNPLINLSEFVLADRHGEGKRRILQLFDANVPNLLSYDRCNYFDVFLLFQPPPA